MWSEILTEFEIITTKIQLDLKIDFWQLREWSPITIKNNFTDIPILRGYFSISRSNWLSDIFQYWLAIVPIIKIVYVHEINK